MSLTIRPRRSGRLRGVVPGGGWTEEWAAVWVGSGAGKNLPAEHRLSAERTRVDQLVLANLLRMNQQRAAKLNLNRVRTCVFFAPA